jgi:hypothetical protein
MRVDYVFIKAGILPYKVMPSDYKIDIRFASGIINLFT